MKEKNINIAIPISTFIKSGGMRVLSHLANNWQNCGCNVEFIVIYKSNPYFPVNCKITQLNASSAFSGYLKCFKYLFRNFKKYDYIIANYCLTAFPIFFASMLRFDLNKNFYYVQAYEPDILNGSGVKHFIFKTISKMSYLLPLKKIVNSKLYLDYKKLKAEMIVYPGLDMDNYFHKDIHFFNNVIKIGTIGRTEEWKGTADVCRAMEILKSDGIQFDYYIAFNDYKTIPHYFVKPDGDDRLAAFYRDMDIVVAACKGQHGAIHYPVIETMAVGTSIICTDYYPSDETNAYKVDQSSPEQIAEAVKEIITDKEKAVIRREQALKDVEQFSWSIVADKFLNYLKEGKKDDYAQ